MEQSETEAFALLVAFAELGGRVIVTARVYSDWVLGAWGRCERITDNISK